MATYYGTYGQKVQYLASDPSDPQIGQVWYNSTSAVLKVRQVTTTGTWAAGGNLNTTRRELANAGIQTAALAFGGATVSVGGSNSTATELYNGTSWAEAASMITARNRLAGAGTQASALAFGGSPSPATSNGTLTEEFTGGPVNVNKTISFS